MLACAVPALVPSAASAACSCQDVSIRQAADRADVVFRGTLVEQSVTGDTRSYSIDVARIYRGRVAETPVVVESPRQGTDCGLGALQVDRSYVVFARENRTALVSERCDATGPATPAYLREVQRVLGPGNALPRPGDGSAEEEPDVEFTRVDGSAPPDLSRLAAPGAAIALIGLLGLVVFRRRH